jgi:hypothetical protein
MAGVMVCIWVILGWLAIARMAMKEKVSASDWSFTGIGGYALMLAPASMAGPFTWLASSFDGIE